MKIRFLVSLLIFASGPGLLAEETSAPGRDFVWIEAESPSAGNFPSTQDNPFRPSEFWETDTLSGGNWIGMKWTSPDRQPFLEYTFESPAAGTFHFYARKFFTFGNFRWKIDGGRWQEAGLARHNYLDAVSFRETDERISLNWFYMGDTKLGQGRHKLRIEPVFESRRGSSDVGYNPIAYDAFLFTPVPFHPSDKAKPGEQEHVQTASSFSMDTPPDPYRSSPIDWLTLNEDFAGQNGGIAVSEGRLVFRDSPEPVRLLGVNMSLRAFANAEGTRFFARFLAKKGFNLVRFDLGEMTSCSKDASGKISLTVDESNLALLVQAVQAFKEHGIYLALTWNVQTTKGLITAVWGEPSGSPEGFVGDVRHPFSSLLYFDPALQSTWQAVWKSVLKARLPGGGSLGADPVLAFVTLNQQDSIFSDTFVPYEAISAGRMLSVEKAFARWLSARPEGNDLAGLLKTWGGGEVHGDAPDEGRVGLLSAAGMSTRRDRRAQETARFLASAQAGFFESMIHYFREELQYKGLLSTSNKLVGSTGALGWINAWSQAAGDVTERHGNFLPYFETKSRIWHASVGTQYQDRSALRFDPLPGRETSRFELPTRSLSYASKPVFFSELSWTTPNRFRSEMPLLATTQASLQQVQALAWNTIVSPYWLSSITGERTPAFTPATMGQMPAFAYAFRKGLLPEGRIIAKLSLSEDSIFSMKLQPLSENFDTQMDAPFFEQPAAGTAGGGRHPAFWTTGRIEVRLNAGADEWVPTEAGTITDHTITAADGAVRWNYKTGVLLVDMPSCKAAGGFLKLAGPISLDGMEIRSDMEYGVICLVSLDGQPIDTSAKILVQVFSEEANTGSYTEGDPIKTIRSAGRPPILIRNFSGHIRFLRPDADGLVAHALDDNGYKTFAAGVGGDLKLLPSTMYYLIEK